MDDRSELGVARGHVMYLNVTLPTSAELAVEQTSAEGLQRSPALGLALVLGPPGHPAVPLVVLLVLVHLLVPHPDQYHQHHHHRQHWQLLVVPLVRVHQH